jgi:hypothetical protein
MFKVFFRLKSNYFPYQKWDRSRVVLKTVVVVNCDEEKYIATPEARAFKCDFGFFEYIRSFGRSTEFDATLHEFHGKGCIIGRQQFRKNFNYCKLAAFKLT